MGDRWTGHREQEKRKKKKTNIEHRTSNIEH